MKRSFYIICFITLFSFYSSAVTLSGANLPYDSSLYMGLVNGPGTGIDIGINVLFPQQDYKWGLDIEQLVTNSGLEQNINILKYGVLFRYEFNETMNINILLGKASFYVNKLVDYNDSLTGYQYEIEEDTRGTGNYYGLSFIYDLGDFFIEPKAVMNSVTDGGNIFEMDLNIGHKF